MAESSKGLGLAALAPNGLNFTKANQSGISPQLSRALSELSKDFGHSITINSGYRSPAYNKAVKGAKSSYHTKGLAADIDMSGWSEAKRQQAIEKLSALGVGGFITYSKSPNMLHIDLRENMHFMFDKTAGLMGKAPGWFREIAAKLGPKTPIQRQMAAEMEQPSEMTRAQAMATGLSPEDQALANAHIAYGDSRALNAQPLSMSPPNPGSLRGLATSMARRGIAPPSNFSGGTPAISPIGSAPVGQVTRAPLGPALARPSQPPSNFAKGTMPTAAPKANRLGGMDYAVAPERFDRPSVPSGIDRPAPPTSRPSLSSPPGLDRPGPVASRPSLSSPVGLDRPGVPTSRPSLATPVGLDRPGPPAQAPAPSQAAVMGALSQRAGLEAIKDDSLVGSVTAHAINPAIANLPNRPLHQVVPPVAMPTVLTNYPVANIPAAQNIGPPRENFSYAAPTASDVYGGKASVGFDSVGNRVSSIPGGTSVTNKYGATTGMVNGYQTAVGSMPSIPGMSMPSKSTVGGAVKGGALGLGVAGPVGGLVGALLGGALASAAAKKNGAAPSVPGQSGGGLGALFGNIFGGGSTASKSGASSGGGTSKSGSGTKSGGGGYQTSAGAQSNSKSTRY